MSYNKGNSSKNVTGASVVDGTIDSVDFANPLTGDVSLGDNVKAKFGAGNDLQIYSNAGNSYISESGTGNLELLADNLSLLNAAGTEYYARFYTNGAAKLYQDGSEKLATTATGVDVTGTATMDGLTVDGDAVIASAVPRLILSETDVTNGNWDFRGSFGNLKIRSLNDDLSTAAPKMQIGANGDISFYEDTGTTPKFYWDASAESLGIGTTSPAAKLDVNGTLTCDGFTSTGIDDNATSTAITIDASKNVGIGVTPESWGTYQTALQVGPSGTIANYSSGSNTQTHLTCNAYALTSPKYLVNSAAASMRMTNGAYDFQVAPSGTAGSAITWTTPLTIANAGDVTVGTGNLVIGTSGKGIDFSATSDGSGTMTSEVLDDYEEGTFTPAITGTTSAGTGTYTAIGGKYTKIGRSVTAELQVNFIGHTGTGNMTITGLPFTANNTPATAVSLRMRKSRIPANNFPQGSLTTTTINLETFLANGTTQNPVALAMLAAGDILVQVTYQTD